MLNDTVMKNNRASLALQWLRIRASTAGDTSLIPDWGSSTCFLAWPKRMLKCMPYNLEGWDGVGGGFKREEACMYLWGIHVNVWQKPT